MSGLMRLSRRRFLQVMASAAGALVVGVRHADAADLPVPLQLSDYTFRGLGPYVSIDANGTVLIGARDPESGTGVATALPRIIADELDADWSQVSVVPLGLGVEDNNGHPHWIYGHQTGGLGDSIPAAWRDLRRAGALARWLLMQAAARQLGVPAAQLRCDKGMVIAPDGRKLGYGALIADAVGIALPATPPAPKTPDRYTLIGQPAGDADARAVVTGQTAFAADSQFNESLFAVLAHSPWPDGRLERIDTSAALAVKGVVKVVQLKPEANVPPGQTVIAPAVAVLAESTWAALQGRKLLKLEWKPGASGSENSTQFEQEAQSLVDSDSAPTTRVRDDGDIVAIARRAARRFEASYVQPWLAHATPEPMNCQVRLDKDKATLVVPTQAPQRAWSVVQRLTGLKPTQIEIQVPRMGGGYGRRLDHDYVAEAVLLAQAVNKPVKLLWTRENDLQRDFYSSGCVHRLSVTLDRKRQIMTWQQRMASASALTHRGATDDRLWTSETDIDQLPAGLVPNYRSDWYAVQSALPRGAARGMPDTCNAFAVESFVDEIAHSMKEDPLDTRLRLIGPARQIPLHGGGTLDTARLAQVLRLATDRIEWKNWLHSVNGLGAACWHLNGAYVAHAIEAAMQGERLIIQRVVCAVDVGRVINPQGLEGQIAGATLDALSNALNLAITFKDGQVQQHDFKDYPLASVLQLPDAVEVITVPGDGEPAGASFLAMPTAAPALANAVFRASAVRVRRLPLMKELLRLL